MPIRILLALLLCAQFAQGQGRHTARSMVITKYGIVATSHVQASQAGAEILRKGGSAVDAAIAANAVLGVTEPMMNGMGGDLFAIYWEAKTGKLYGLNSSGWAPQALTIEHMRAKDVTAMPQYGIDYRHRTRSCRRMGRSAWTIRPTFLERSFPVCNLLCPRGISGSELIHGFWADAPEVFAKDPEGQKVYLPNGSRRQSAKSSAIQI